MAGERTLPGLGLTGFWDEGSVYKAQMDENLRRLSLHGQPYVLSSVATEPASPVDGAIHRATGAWGGATAGQIVVRDNGAWVAYTPAEGWEFWDRAADVKLRYDGTTWQTVAEGGGGGLTDAPSDGTIYGRQNAGWVAVPTTGGSASPAKGFAAFANGSQNTVNGSFTTVLFQTEEFDTDGGYNPATGVYTVPAALNGKMMVFVAGWRTSTLGATLYIRRNGTIIAQSNSEASRATVTTRPFIVATGDTFDVQCFANGVTSIEATTSFFGGFVVTGEGGGSGGGGTGVWGDNLITNPGFETGDLTGWTVGGTGNIASVTGGRTGTLAPRSGSRMAENSLGSLATLTQSVSVPAGALLVDFTAFAALDFGGDRCRAVYRIKGSGGVVLWSNERVLESTAAVNIWNSLGLVAPVPAGALTAEMELRVENVGGTNASGGFDDTSIRFLTGDGSSGGGAATSISHKIISGAYTLLDSDLAGNVYLTADTSGGACTITVPDTLTGTEPVLVERSGANGVSFVAGGTTTIRSADGHLSLRVDASVGSLVPKGSDVYTLSGDLAA